MRVRGCSQQTAARRADREALTIRCCASTACQRGLGAPHSLRKLQRCASRSFPHNEVEQESDGDPCGAEQFGVAIEVEPDESTYKNSAERGQCRERDLFLRAELVVNKRGRIHADERDKRAEVKQLRAPFDGQKKVAEQRHGSEQQHVVARDSSLGAHHAEKPPWERIRAPHSIEEARRAELCRYAGTHIGDQQRGVQQLDRKSTRL